jgi:hypothetical protein
MGKVRPGLKGELGEELDGWRRRKTRMHDRCLRLALICQREENTGRAYI